jgi:amino acid adenylation domain-containing protein
VNLYPQKVAVQFANETITYQELELKIKCLSQKLQSEGIKKGDIVAVYIPNSIELIVAIYAILYCRAIILPVDIDTPIERMQKIFSDSQPTVVLQKDGSKNEVTLDVKSISVASTFVDTSNNIIDSIKIETSTEDLAFCIYTSGSTGIPKGVLLSYKGILNHAAAKAELLNISKDSKLCLSFNVGFVASIWQILVPLLSGATLLIYDNDLIKKPYHFLKQAEIDNIVAVSVTPHTLQAYMQYVKIKKQKISFANTSYIILTGEKLQSTLVDEFYETHHTATLINAYGQTECSDDTFHYMIPRSVSFQYVPIGTPISNIKGFILNDNLNEDDIGELYIGGVGVSKGYLHNKDLTNIKFVNLSLFETSLYRTGDYVKKNAYGIVTYIGRIDNQNKIRGHRVELEEIEAVIDSFQGIAQAIVRAVDLSDTDKILEAIYVGTHDIDKGTLQEFLKKKLPDYMIPVKFTQIESFVYTPNGKIDRKSIDSTIVANIEKNSSKTDSELSELYQRAFAVIKSKLDEAVFSNITIDTNLSGVGIDSITFIKIVVSLEAEFDFEFDDEMLLFTAFPTLRAMIEYVESKVSELSNGENND